MRVATVIASTALLISAVAAGALTGESIGVVRAVTDASATGPDGTRTLMAGSVVEAGELIATGGAGLAQIAFTEGPLMALDTETSMTVAAIDPTGDAGGPALAIKAHSGKYRYKSGKRRGEIHTPSAEIFHSGTAFDFTVTKSGGTRLLLLEGEVTMCGTAENGTCQTVATPCAMLRTDDGKSVEQVGSVAGSGTGDESEGVTGAVTGDEVGLEQEIRENFPFQRSQSDLLEDFQVAGRQCGKATVGGLAEAPLEQPGLRIPPEVIVPVAAAAIICILICRDKGGPPIDAPNHTN